MIKGYTSDLDVFRAEWVRFQAQIAPLERGGIPFMPVPGNYDLLDAERKPGAEGVYRDIWGETYYSWNYSNAHFIVLNTVDGKSSEIAGEQLAWLKKDLAAATRSEHIFVFMHRPIYTLANEDELHQIFLDYDVSAVICGHMHHYNFQERDGIPYIMTVSATHMGTPFPMAAGSFHHMLQVTVRDSAFRVAVIEAGHIFLTDIVAFEDNQGLYQLQKKFYSQARMAFGDLERDGNRYEVTLHVNNPSEQEFTTYFEWQLPNERWSVEPLRGRRMVLPPKSWDVPVPFTLVREYAHPPEAYPNCIARALYLTTDGDVVQSEHTFEIVAELDPQ